MSHGSFKSQCNDEHGFNRLIACFKSFRRDIRDEIDGEMGHNEPSACAAHESSAFSAEIDTTTRPVVHLEQRGSREVRLAA